MILRLHSRLVASPQQDATSGRVANVSTTVLMIAAATLLLAMGGSGNRGMGDCPPARRGPLSLPSVSQA